MGGGAGRVSKNGAQPEGRNRLRDWGNRRRIRRTKVVMWVASMLGGGADRGDAGVRTLVRRLLSQPMQSDSLD
jgi:hypothetical protein